MRNKLLVVMVLVVASGGGDQAVADTELEYWVNCVDEHSQAFGIRLDRKAALNCLAEQVESQRKNVDALYSNRDTEEVMTDQAFRAAIKEWEILRDRAGEILNPKINRQVTTNTDENGLKTKKEKTTGPPLPTVKGYTTISR